MVSGKGKCVVRPWEGVASPGLGESRARVRVRVRVRRAASSKQQAASSATVTAVKRDGDVASLVGRTPLRATPYALRVGCRVVRTSPHLVTLDRA